MSMVWKYTLAISALLNIVFLGGWRGFGAHTQWAAGFKSTVFSEISCGTTKAEVKKLLGEPLWINNNLQPDTGETEVWGFSGPSEQSKDFEQRGIAFDSDGRSVRKLCTRYSD